MEDRAFSECPLLKSIFMPASLQIVGPQCFFECTALENLVFEAGSKLERIEERAFSRCTSLKSICIPAPVQEIPEECFFNCQSLVSLTFDSPSRLQRFCLSIPRSLTVIDIPDSVTFLHCRVDTGTPHHQTLSFGNNSRLQSLKIAAELPINPQSLSMYLWPPKAFVRVCEPTLREFRAMFECEHKISPGWNVLSLHLG
jgi:hypothetical protein